MGLLVSSGGREGECDPGLSLAPGASPVILVLSAHRSITPISAVIFRPYPPFLEGCQAYWISAHPKYLTAA